MKEWVSTGDFPLSICDPPLKRSDGEDAQVRLIRLIGMLEVAATGYANQFEEQNSRWLHRPNSLSSAHLWTGIWQFIEKALRQIQQAAEDYGEEQGRAPLLH